jgi:hypothetical protein
VLGDADAVRARCVDNQDPACAGGFDIHIVDAGAGPRDNPQPRRGGQQVGRDFGGTPHHQCVGVGEVFDEVGRLAAGAGIDLPAAFRAKQIERGSGEVVGDYDFQ